MTWLDGLVETAHASLSERVRSALWLRGVNDDQISNYKVGYLRRVLDVGGDCPEEFLRWARGHDRHLSDVLVFPLTTALGEVAGVQFRQTSRTEKGYFDYIISKEEPVFFGLHQAISAIWETEAIWLVEGVFDLFALQRHVPNIVSTLHAGISASLWQWLRRMVNTIYLAYDMDDTGKSVSYSILKENREAGSPFQITLVKFPRVVYRGGKIAKDPGDLWEAWGDSKLGAFLRQTTSGVADG